MGDDHDPELVGRVRREVTQRAQHLRRLRERPIHRPAENERPDRMQVVLEGGGDAEVAAAAAQPPEKLGLAARVDADPVRVGGDEVDGAQVVDGEPVPAHEVSDPAAERQPADPDAADGAARGGQPVPLRGEVQFRPDHAARRPGDARSRVDGHRLHVREIDHDAAVAHRMAEDRVPAAADGDRQLALAREPQRRLDVVGARAARDQGRPAVDGAVPGPPGLVVALLAGP